MDKYTIKMFPQAYRDIDKIYGQALLVSNYADNAIALAENLKSNFKFGRTAISRGRKKIWILCF